MIHIIKTKAEPATPRIKRLLELISLYSFNLYYMKGKDMILSNILSRHIHDNSNLHNIIPISFNMFRAMCENYYNIETKERYFMQTRSQMKSSRVTLPEVHDAKKSLDMNVLPEKQKIKSQNKKIVKNKPSLGQGRSGMRHKSSTC